MPIISKETWDKLIPEEEKKKIRKTYQRLLGKEYSDIYTDEEMNGALCLANAMFPKETLQPRPLTYEDVARELFKDGAWQPDEDEIVGVPVYNEIVVPKCWLNFTSQKQTEKLFAINKLLNVARFLNGKDWEPDWSDIGTSKWSIEIDNRDNKLYPKAFLYSNHSIVYFPNSKTVLQAIQIIGKDTVRLALDSDY